MTEQIALIHHLGYNLYPPVPYMQAAAEAAIEYHRTGVTPAGCPKGYVPAPPELVGGRTDGFIPAREVIENCHLEDFLT